MICIGFCLFWDKAYLLIYLKEKQKNLWGKCPLHYLEPEVQSSIFYGYYNCIFVNGFSFLDIRRVIDHKMTDNLFNKLTKCQKTDILGAPSWLI